MKKKLITTTVLTAAVFLAGAFITQAQTNVGVEAQQRTEVRADSEIDDTEEEQVQQEANYNNSRSNRANINVQNDPPQATDKKEVRDTDSDGDGLDDAVSDSRRSPVKEIDKASPKLMEALSIDADSPLRNAGVHIGVRGDVCAEGEGCDDEDASVSPGKADVSIQVSGDDVRGWSGEQKEAVRTRLEAASEMITANDFGLRVASAALDNDNVVDIATDKDNTEVRYKTRMRLFGFIPTQATATARATSDGETSVEYPWYSFLAQKADDSSFSQLAADLRADHDVMISVEEEGVKRTIRDDETEAN